MDLEASYSRTLITSIAEYYFLYLSFPFYTLRTMCMLSVGGRIEMIYIGCYWNDVDLLWKYFLSFNLFKTGLVGREFHPVIRENSAKFFFQNLVQNCKIAPKSFKFFQFYPKGNKFHTISSSNSFYFWDKYMWFETSFLI